MQPRKTWHNDIDTIKSASIGIDAGYLFNKWREDMLDNVIGWAKKLTEAGIAVIALAVVVQIIFGADAAFLPGDVTGSLLNIINAMGSANLVGLIAAGLIYKIYTR